ncbi:gamma-tubulin complex component 2-like [Dendronephthya gigantea]|uniref:gamma-tubulin complex component 2-like n=1 Tax=Dendronephthya gigantea TaxID=151771 RepID=UPI0010697CF1|nr:gamma-tubulin complex component 2-like [Dendronephthya gigantea]
MSEFQVHHRVAELLKLLGVTGGDGPEVYTEVLTKNMTPYVTTQVSAHTAKKKIAETTPYPREFLQKYDLLKSKNIRELDPLVFLLSRISDDPSMVASLERIARERGHKRQTDISKPAASSSMAETLQNLEQYSGQMTAKELEEFRTQLASITGPSASPAAEATLKNLREKQARKGLPGLPLLPEWFTTRPHLTGDFVQSIDQPQPAVPVKTLPLKMQEIAVIEDLLFLMTGVEGKYIRLSSSSLQGLDPPEFIVDSTLDISLQELVQRILPICTHYSLLCRFIEDKSGFMSGLVNQAVSAAMRTIMQEYYIFVAQLEHQFNQGELSLQKLWFLIQPCLGRMDVLSSIAEAIETAQCKGGAVLTLLHERTTNLTGDATSQDLYLWLTQAACVPYFDMLEQWIYKGLVNDPYLEFLVAEQEAFQKEKLTEEYNDAYWRQRYTIVQHKIPVFLETVAQKILSTGKYLNVIRQCGRDVQCPDAEEIIYTLREREYVDRIEKAYDYASKTLLDLLMEEKDLMGRLRSIKLYFLMGQGDFFVQFMDLAEDEMKKNMDDIFPSRLETLLELSLRTTAANADPFKDDLRVELLPYDLITQLFRILSVANDRAVQSSLGQDPTEIQISGLEAFSFDYVVKWPVSLILSRKALTKYQLLFRHLFYAKHVERQLCRIWLNDKTTKQHKFRASRWYVECSSLRTKMLQFVQNYEYYMMSEVIEPYWHILENNLKDVNNVDDVLTYHNDFLDKCLKDCMLTAPELLKIVSKLMMVCVTFTNCIQRITQTVINSENPTAEKTGKLEKEDLLYDKQKKKAAAKILSKDMDEVINSSDFERTVANFDSNFTKYLLGLLEKLSSFSKTDFQHQMLNIVTRLDHNGFYGKQLEMSSAAETLSVASSDSNSSAGQSPSSTLSDISLNFNYDKPSLMPGRMFPETSIKTKLTLPPSPSRSRHRGSASGDDDHYNMF